MQPYYEKSNFTLYQANCLELLAELVEVLSRER